MYKRQVRVDAFNENGITEGSVRPLGYFNIIIFPSCIHLSLIHICVHDVHFDNITFMGNKCETWQDMRLVTELANDIYVNGTRICRQMKF